jgi:hypothetical protein
MGEDQATLDPYLTDVRDRAREEAPTDEVREQVGKVAVNLERARLRLAQSKVTRINEVLIRREQQLDTPDPAAAGPR